MALFKVNRGNSATLPSTMTDGYAYFCTDTGEFFIDYADSNGELHRKQINAEEAKKLTGYDIANALNDSEVEIPTSKAVLDALNLKQDVITGTEGQYVGFDSDGNTAAFDLPSEVIISDTEPTDETAEIWINTSEEWNDNIAGGVSSWNDLTDKPFYKEQGEKVVLVETEVSFDQYGDGMLPISPNVSSGFPCVVVWDGVEYECTPVAFVSYGKPSYIIGRGEDIGYPGPDEDKPFSIIINVGLGATVKDYERHASRTISITQKTETIHRIDPEYLPEGYPYKEKGEEVVIEWDGNTDGLANVGVFYKVSDAVFENLSGANVIVGDLYGELHFDVTLGEKTNQQGIDGYYPSDASATNGMPAVAVVHEGSDPGTYFFKEGDHLYVSKLNVVLKTIHPITPEFLPYKFYTVTVDLSTNKADYTGEQITAMAERGWVTMRLAYNGQDQGALYIYTGSRIDTEAMFVNVRYNEPYGFLVQYRSVAWADGTTTGGQRYTASAVADAVGDTPTAAEFNALLASLRNAGLLATS